MISVPTGLLERLQRAVVQEWVLEGLPEVVTLGAILGLRASICSESIGGCLARGLTRADTLDWALPRREQLRTDRQVLKVQSAASWAPVRAPATVRTRPRGSRTLFAALSLGFRKEKSPAPPGGGSRQVAPEHAAAAGD